MKALCPVYSFIFKLFWGSKNLGIPPTHTFIPFCIFSLFSNTTGNINTTANLKLPPPFLLYSLWFFTLYYKAPCLWGPLVTDARNSFVLNCHFTQSSGNPSWRQRSLCWDFWPLDATVDPAEVSRRAERHLREKYFSLSQKILSLLYLKYTLQLAEKRVCPWFRKHLSVHFCLHGFQNLIF